MNFVYVLEGKFFGIGLQSVHGSCRRLLRLLPLLLAEVALRRREELDRHRADLELLVPYAVLLPGVHLQPALDEDGAALREELSAQLRELVPCVDIDKKKSIKKKLFYSQK